jgi:hypothetical protein
VQWNAAQKEHLPQANERDERRYCIAFFSF